MLPTLHLSPEGRLRRAIVAHFNKDEVRSLCSDLGINDEQLPAETLETLARELIRTCARNGRLPNLLAVCQEQRPFIPWHDFLYPSDSDDSVANAVRRYLHYLQDRYRYLELTGLGAISYNRPHPELQEMYMPLNARPHLLKSEAQADETLLALNEPEPLFSLVQQHDGLVVLGDPGSGKTTFLKYLALQLANGQGPALGLGNRLPIVLPLSAYANALAEEDLSLADFFARYYQGRGIDLPFEAILEGSLAQGEVLFLLDGVDEVQELPLRHLLVRRVVDFFLFQRRNGNKFVITSRLVGYRQVRQAVDGLVECTLVELDSAAIEGFIRRWFGPSSDGSLDDGVPMRAALLTAVAHSPSLRKLAANPLLLTILVLMKQQGMELPERRVALYEQYVQTMLHHWRLARGLDRPTSRPIDVAEMMDVLPQVALWMQQASPGIGLVPQAALLQRLTAVYHQRQHPQPNQAAHHFLADVGAFAGLLVERGPGEFGFIHRTFQEYLAAVALVQQEQVAGLLVQHAANDHWRELILLTLAHMGVLLRQPERATAVVQALLAASTETGGQSVVVAGQALADLWPGGITTAGQTAVIAALQQTLAHDQVLPPQRVAVGQALGQAGDPRPEIMSVDAMPLCFVPGGPFWLGDGKAAHLVDLAPFWLGRYPVSQAQFAEFVVAGGYGVADYWPEAAAVGRWRQGQTQDWESRGWRNRPYDDGRFFSLPNHPVVGITWYEALAFCRWLSQRWQQAGWLPPGWQVGLPSEAEWEKGARGGLQLPAAPILVSPAQLTWPDVGELRVNPKPQRRFPWGNTLREQRANFAAHHLAVTNTPGCFAAAASPYGGEEMSGNVWEWTGSQFQPYPYMAPAVAGDGREETAVKLFAGLVLRGGAYWSEASNIRCSARVRRAPHDRNSSYGFRVRVGWNPMSGQDHR